MSVQHIERVNRTAAALGRDDLLIDLADVFNKALLLKRKPVLLPFYAQRHTDILEKGYTILEGVLVHACFVYGVVKFDSDSVI